MEDAAARVAALESQAAALREAIAETRRATRRKRKQLEALARGVPEIGDRPRALRRLELLIEAAASPESPHAVSRETGALRERAWADAAAAREAERFCNATL